MTLVPFGLRNGIATILVVATILRSATTIAPFPLSRDCRRNGGSDCLLPQMAPCWSSDQLVIAEICCNLGPEDANVHCFSETNPGSAHLTQEECCPNGFNSSELLKVEVIASPAIWPALVVWPPTPPDADKHLANQHEQLIWEKMHMNATGVTRRAFCGQEFTVRYFRPAKAEVARIFEEQDRNLFGFSTEAPPEDGVAVDVGAHVGVVTMLLAKCYGLHVVAFEPVPSTFRYLLWNLRTNGVLDQVWPVNAGGGASTAVSALIAPPGRTTMSMLSQMSCPAKKDRDLPKAFQNGVQSCMNLPDNIVIPVDHLAVPVLDLWAMLLHANNFKKKIYNRTDTSLPEVMKLDCEGCEYELLKESRAIEVFARVPIVIGEVHVGDHRPQWDTSELSPTMAGNIENVKIALCRPQFGTRWRVLNCDSAMKSN